MTTMTVDQLHVELAQRADGSDPYGYLNRALPLLEAQPDDQRVRLLTVREFLRLGLVGPARELLEGQIWAGPEAQQLEAIAAALTGLPDGALPWHQQAHLWEANLTAWTQRSGAADVVREAWTAGQHHCQAFRDQQGHLQLRRRDDQGRWRWVPSLGDHEAAAQARPLPEESSPAFPGPYLCEGVELGAYFERLHRQTRRTYLDYSCPLFVVEPDPVALGAVFHLRNWQSLLADPRVYVFTGDCALDELLRTLQDSSNLPWPRQAVHMSGWRHGVSLHAAPRVQEAHAHYEQRVLASYAEIDAQYAGRDIAYWARRFDEALTGAAEPLRILCAVSRQTTFLKHSVRDARRALEAMGHRVEVLTEATDHEMIGPLTFHEAIRQFDPDVFMAWDHLRPEFARIIPTQLPVLTWDQDQLPHVFTKANLDRVAAHDFLAGYSKPAHLRAGRPAAQYLNARVPACPEQFSGPPLTAEEAERYTCDVSYVSHASQTPAAFHTEERNRYRDANVLRLLDALYERLPAQMERYGVMNGRAARALLTEAEAATGVRVQDAALRERLLSWYLWRLGDRVFRHEALEWVAAWSARTERSFRIYGRGWEQHPTLAPFAAGPADNGRELLCIYRASRINLQLMPAGFIHQRSLDGLAAGGFFLNRQSPANLRAPLLRQLLSRVDELGITDTRSLLTSDDAALQSAVAAYFEQWSAHLDPNDAELLMHLRVAGEWEYAEEVFPEFEAIIFDSPTEFEERAELYLGDDTLRTQRTKQLRQVVLDRFTYRATMQQLLTAMRDYLRSSTNS